MTREEAYAISDSLSMNCIEREELIDTIFDDIETRTCDTCKYCLSNTEGIFFCSYWNENPMMYKMVYLTDFCSRHKDNA